MTAAEIGRELARGSVLREQLSASLRILDVRLGAARSALYLADRAQRSLELEIAHGLPSEQFQVRYGAGVAGRVVETGQPIVVPVVCHDAMACAEFVDPLLWLDAGWNLVAMPLALGTNQTGVLCVYFQKRDPQGFESRIAILEVIASLLSKALRSEREGRESERLVEVAREPAAKKSASGSVFEYANLIGSSSAMRQLYEQIGQVARTAATALLRGESGTGKELVASAIHHNSPRARMPFVKINCAALPETLFESELFGHERGAFTGAIARRKGRFELAQGGTLFLDEIGELSLATQAKLLRVLQFREFERLGGTETLRADVRLVAATNRDIERAVAEGTFREDLYYRVNVFSLTLPPLRERRVDIPALAEYFVEKFAAEHGRPARRIASAALDLLTQYHWPGNVRELENIIERAVVVCNGSLIQVQHLPQTLLVAPSEATPQRLTLGQAVARVERQMIEQALRETNGNLTRAADMLGSTERVIRYKVQKLGIELARLRSSGDF